MSKITRNLIAPCGMDCALCMGYQREKLHCPGCHGDDREKQKSCRACVIKNCTKRNQHGWQYCFECDTYPCARLKQLDKRYRTKYEMSMIENLDYIRDHGIQQFVRHEQKRWVKNGRVYCVHRHTYDYQD